MRMDLINIMPSERRQAWKVCDAQTDRSAAKEDKWLRRARRHGKLEGDG